MTPKTARNLSAVAFVALILPCQNLMVWLDVLLGSFGWYPLSLILGSNPWIWWLRLALPAFLLSLVLYLYLRRRDFPQLCADCATRKPLVWTLFFLFAFLSLVHPVVTPICASDYPDEDFEVSSPDDGSAALAWAAMPDPADIGFYARHNNEEHTFAALDRTDGDAILSALSDFDSFEPFGRKAHFIQREDGAWQFSAAIEVIAAPPQSTTPHRIAFYRGADAETGAPVWGVSLDQTNDDSDAHVRLVPSDVAATLQSHFDAWAAADHPASQPMTSPTNN